MPDHAYSTYIQVTNHANMDKKPIKRQQKSLKPRKTIQKLKNFHKNKCKKAYDSPTPKSHNVLIRDKEPQPTTKTQNTINTQEHYTNICKLRHKSKTQHHPINYKDTHIYT